MNATAIKAEFKRLAEVLNNEGYPTEGETARAFWKLSTDLGLTPEWAASVMRDAGYEPFQGYPLTRRLDYLRSEIQAMQKEIAQSEAGAGRPPRESNYVAGFLVNNAATLVVLMLKNRPKWQAGQWNAVGGKIEPGETPAQAMRREFREETGVDIANWQQFGLLRDADNSFGVHWFIASSDDLRFCETKTDEEVRHWPVSSLPANAIWNIPVLLNMAFLVWLETAPGFEIIERRFSDD